MSQSIFDRALALFALSRLLERLVAIFGSIMTIVFVMLLKFKTMLADFNHLNQGG